MPPVTLNLKTNRCPRPGGGFGPRGTGVVIIGGSLTSASLANAFADRSGGTVNLVGTLNNAGAVLDIGSGGLFGAGGLHRLAGTIAGGTVTHSGSPPSLAVNFGVLDGVTLGSSINLVSNGSGSGNHLYLKGTTTLSNGVTLDAGNLYVSFTSVGGAASLVTPADSAATMKLAGGQVFAGSEAGTLTIGSGITVKGYGTIWPSGASPVPAVTVLNNGTLWADTASQALLVNPTALVNAGVMKVTAGTLSVQETTPLTGGGQAQVTSGTLQLGSSASFGNLELSGGTVASSGALSVSNGFSQTGGSLSAATLSVTQASGSISQTGGTIAVTGAATFTAANGDITLTGSSNNFNTVALSAVGGAIRVADANALTVTTLTPGPQRAVSLTAGGALVLPSGAIDTGTADLTLVSGGSLTTPGALSGANVTVSAGTGLTLDHNVTASGSLALSALSGGLRVNSGKVVQTTGSGSLSMTGVGGTGASNQYGVSIAGTVRATGSGSILMEGYSQGTNRDNTGVYVAGSGRIEVDTGSLSLTGQGSTVATGGGNKGIEVEVGGVGHDVGTSGAGDLTAGSYTDLLLYTNLEV